MIQGDKLYLYVGSQPQVNSTNLKVFNNGTASQGGWNGGSSTDVKLTSGDWDSFNLLKSRIMVDGAGGTANLMVFAIRSNQRHLGMALYTLKIWDNSVLVRDFVPCYNKTTLVRGLYDTVNDTFYTNAGNGTFEIGPEI